MTESIVNPIEQGANLDPDNNMASLLEAEGVTEDSQEYKDMMTRILEVYGYKTLDAATGSGIPEAFIRSATASQLAIQIIEKNAQ